jgi:hypothetical protein
MATFMVIGFVPSGSALAALDSKGTDFWLAFIQNYSGYTPTLTLFISGETATTGTVDIPGLSFSAPFTVTPGSITAVDIPAAAQITGSDSVQNKGIHVTAAAEVTVYGLNRFPATTDAFLGLPTDILGTDYIALGYSGLNASTPSEFGVTATQANTTVNITPTVTTGARAAGVPYTITLNQGETYQLQGYPDLSGSVISSDKPIAVFGGAQCANIPLGILYCDHVVEQLPPISAWGRSFLSVPLATRLHGDTFRIIASQDATQVNINGTLVATLNKGQFHEQIITGAAVITTSGPALVAQYSNGTGYDGVTSDPFMMLVTPYEQYLTNYTVATPASGFDINFVNVVVPDSEVSNITLDGVPVLASSFTAIGSSGYSGAQLPISVGTHNLAGTLPFGAFVYGFGTNDSYGYASGGSLSPVAVVRSLSLTPKTGTITVGSPYCVNALVSDQDSLPVADIRVDFTVTGVNPTAGSAISAANGIAQYCYTGSNTGSDAIASATGTYNDSASVQWIAANVAPTATSLTINGTAQVGQVLTGSYVYSDADSDPQDTTATGSSYRFVRSTDGSVATLGDNSDAVSGMTGGSNKTYTLQAPDQGNYLFYCVTPKASAGASPGSETCSIATAVVVAAPVDIIPNAFSFTARTGVALSTLTISNSITVSDIDTASAIGIVGGEYAVSSDSGVTWSAWSASVPATVNLNDQIKVRQTSSVSFGTLTTATLTIGGVDGAFDVTTLPPVVSYTAPSAVATGDITASFTGGGAGCGYSVSQYIPLSGHAASPPAAAPAGIVFPHGLFDFIASGCTPGSTITLVITYPQALPAGTVYWKYGPTPTDGSYHWYQLPATINGNTATFSIIDGGLGDDDLTANGIIVDQGGPGVPGEAASIPTLSEWALLLLAGLMGLFGVGAMRRREAPGL